MSLCMRRSIPADAVGDATADAAAALCCWCCCCCCSCPLHLAFLDMLLAALQLKFLMLPLFLLLLPPFIYLLPPIFLHLFLLHHPIIRLLLHLFLHFLPNAEHILAIPTPLPAILSNSYAADAACHRSSCSRSL